MDGEVRVPAGGDRVHRAAAGSEKQRDLLVISGLAEASALVPVVGACYPLDRIADAYRHVDAGHKKGTIVVTMS